MLSDGERRFLADRKIAHLATADRRAVPHVVAVCFAMSEGTLYITIDEKPKRDPGTTLKRVRNIMENPAVAVVVDRYDDDWALLGWVMLRGRAEILTDGMEHDDAQALLRSRWTPRSPMLTHCSEASTRSLANQRRRFRWCERPSNSIRRRAICTS